MCDLAVVFAGEEINVQFDPIIWSSTIVSIIRFNMTAL